MTWFVGMPALVAGVGSGPDAALVRTLARARAMMTGCARRHENLTTRPASHDEARQRVDPEGLRPSPRSLASHYWHHTIVSVQCLESVALVNFKRSFAPWGASENLPADTNTLGGVRSAMRRSAAPVMAAGVLGRQADSVRLETFDALMTSPQGAEDSISFHRDPPKRSITGPKISIDRAMPAERAARGFIQGGIASALGN